MDTDGKLDMLLKLVQGNERKRMEADERTRAEYQDLKRTVESRIPVVERKVEELGVAFQELNTKVDHLEGQLQRPIKEEQPAAISESHATTPPAQATWEDLDDLKTRFPGALAWGQAEFQGGDCRILI